MVAVGGHSDDRRLRSRVAGVDGAGGAEYLSNGLKAIESELSYATLMLTPVRASLGEQRFRDPQIFD